MNHTHLDNTFPSAEGATTPTLRNAPSLLLILGQLPAATVHYHRLGEVS